MCIFAVAPPTGSVVNVIIGLAKHCLVTPSLPPRGAWSMSVCACATNTVNAVAPPTGSVVNVRSTPRHFARRTDGRSPHGERGQCQATAEALDRLTKSLPPRGAWSMSGTFTATHPGEGNVAPPTGSVVNVHQSNTYLTEPQVAPPTGSVVNVFSDNSRTYPRRSRSPHGERGLKCLIAVTMERLEDVAPPTGSVD